MKIGIEAFWALNIIISSEAEEPGLLREGGCTSVCADPYRLEEMDAEALLDLVRRATERLDFILSQKTPERNYA